MRAVAWSDVRLKNSGSKLRAPFHLHSAVSPRQRDHDFLQARHLVSLARFPRSPCGDSPFGEARSVMRAVRCRDTSNQLLHPTYLLDLHPRSWLSTCLVRASDLLRGRPSRGDRRTWRFHDAVARFGGSCGKREGCSPSLYAPDTRFASDIPSPSGSSLRHHRPVCAVKGFPSPKDLGWFLRGLVKGRALHNPRCLPSVCVRAPRYAACAAQ